MELSRIEEYAAKVSLKHAINMSFACPVLHAMIMSQLAVRKFQDKYLDIFAYISLSTRKPALSRDFLVWFITAFLSAYNGPHISLRLVAGLGQGSTQSFEGAVNVASLGVHLEAKFEIS